MTDPADRYKFAERIEARRVGRVIAHAKEAADIEALKPCDEYIRAIFELERAAQQRRIEPLSTFMTRDEWEHRNK